MVNAAYPYTFAKNEVLQQIKIQRCPQCYAANQSSVIVRTLPQNGLTSWSTVSQNKKSGERE
ncbi:hypothetical protein ACTXT7_006770 [Hymenolepis weldensis]